VHFVYIYFYFQAFAADKEENGVTVEISLSTGNETPSSATDRVVNCV
jgi:hypothetical protein